MKHDSKLGTVENVVSAICFGVGALLVVLAVHTLFAVKTVNANGPYDSGPQSRPEASATADLDPVGVREVLAQNSIRVRLPALTP